MELKVPPPPSLMKPLEIPKKLLMGPGPSNCSERVLAANALPMLGHLHPEFVKVMDEVKSGIQYAFQTCTPYVLAISGTGHAGMEAAICNLIEPNDVILVAVNGIWGQRAADSAARHGADVRKLITSAGLNFDLEQIRAALEEHRPKVLFVTSGESSTGVYQPLDGIGKLCHSVNCLLLVDSVASLGGVPIYMDAMEVDVMYSGSQKVLGVPPGTAPIAFSLRARKAIVERTTTIRSFYFDMNWLWNYWGCEDEPRKYHHTGPISSIYALREGLAMLCEEGLEKCWKRHKDCANRLYKGIQDMGLSLMVKNPDARLPTVTTIRVPEGIDWKMVTNYAMDKYLVEISGGLGETTGRVWRIGIMGVNASKQSVDLVLNAFKEGYEKAAIALKL